MTAPTDDHGPLPEQGAAPARPPSRARQVVATLVTVVTLVVVFGAVLPQLADYDVAFDAIRTMSTAALTLLAAITIANIVIYVWPFSAALPELGFGPAFVLRQTSFAISNGIPAGGAFGLGVQYSMLGDLGVGAGRAATAIGVTGLWNMLVTLLLPVLAVVALVVVGEPEAELAVVASLGVIAVVLIGGLLVVLFRSESAARRIGETIDRLVGRLPGVLGRSVRPRVTAALLEFRATTVDMVRDRGGAITVANVGQQLVQFAVLLVALRGIQSGTAVTTTVAEVLVAFSVGRLGSFVPLTPGGLGTVDALITAILVAFGATEGDALAATLLWRASTYFPQMFIGIGTFLLWRRRRGPDRA